MTTQCCSDALDILRLSCSRALCLGVECQLSAACSDVLEVLRLSCSCALCLGIEWQLSAACSDILDVLSRESSIKLPVRFMWSTELNPALARAHALGRVQSSRALLMCSKLLKADRHQGLSLNTSVRTRPKPPPPSQPECRMLNS